MRYRESFSARAVVRATRASHWREFQSEPPLVVATLFALYAVGFLGLLLLRPWDERTFVAVEDVMGIVPPVLAGLFALVAGQRSAGHVRLGWWLIGAACLLWGAGDVIWTVYEVVLEQDPFPSLADIGYLAMPPLIALGLVVLSSERRRLAHARPALDGVALVLAAASLVWYVVLQPTYSDSTATPWEKVIGAAYPVGDLVVVYALVVAVQRRWGLRDSAVLLTLLAGMLLLVAADVGFAYQTLEGTYTSTSLVNLGWPSGFLCIAYAGVLAGHWRLSYAVDEVAAPRHDWALPIALSPLIVALAFVAVREPSPAISVPLFAMVGIAALALVARLMINVGLGREIDAQRERLFLWIEAHRRSAQA